MMKIFFQLFLGALVSMAAIAGPTADRYPAGLDPSLCPNYPHCDNVLLAARNGASTNYHVSTSNIAAPDYYHLGHSGHFPGAFSGNAGFLSNGYSAPQYPAGVNPASCPNYPYCTVSSSLGYHASPLPGFAVRQYPEGVNPNACPNYPFCH